MEILATLRRSGGLDALARKLDVAPAVAVGATEALLPALVGGFAKRSAAFGEGRAGLGALVDLIDKQGGAAMAANVMGPDAVESDRGKLLLVEIFGSKDVSSAVASHAADDVGLDAELLKQALPVLAMLVGGYLSARVKGSGAQGSGGLANLDAVLDWGDGRNPLDAIIENAGKARPS